MNKVDKYILQFNGERKDLLQELVLFMREVFPYIEETFDNNMPTYKFGNNFIAFEPQKKYFIFYTQDKRVL